MLCQLLPPLLDGKILGAESFFLMTWQGPSTPCGLLQMCNNNSRPYPVYIFEPHGVQYPQCRSCLSILFTVGQKKERLDRKKESSRWEEIQPHEGLYSMETLVNIPPLMTFPPLLLPFPLSVIWRFCSRKKQF